MYHVCWCDSLYILGNGDWNGCCVFVGLWSILSRHPKCQLLTKEHACFLCGKCQWGGSDGCLECCQVLTCLCSETDPWFSGLQMLSPCHQGLGDCGTVTGVDLHVWKHEYFFLSQMARTSAVQHAGQFDNQSFQVPSPWLMLALSTVFHPTPLLNYVPWPNHRMP